MSLTCSGIMESQHPQLPWHPPLCKAVMLMVLAFASQVKS